MGRPKEISATFVCNWWRSLSDEERLSIYLKTTSTDTEENRSSFTAVISKKDFDKYKDIMDGFMFYQPVDDNSVRVKTSNVRVIELLKSLTK